jgi:hypothetical protein
VVVGCLVSALKEGRPNDQQPPKSLRCSQLLHESAILTGDTLRVSARIWLYKDLTTHPVVQYVAWISLPVFLILFSAGFVHIIAPQSIGNLAAARCNVSNSCLGLGSVGTLVLQVGYDAKRWLHFCCTATQHKAATYHKPL